MDPALVELFRSSEAGEEVEVIARLRELSVLPPGIRRVSTFGPIITGRVVREQLRPVWASEDILSLKAPRTYYWDDDLDLEAGTDIELQPSDAVQRRTELASGRGVVVGICDWGMDFAHDDFRHADGSSRLLALWDQRSSQAEPPAPYGYGRVMPREEIDRALQTLNPYETLDYRIGRSLAGMHGTHVAGIAAGNGRSSGSVRSAAYDADLVFVHLHAGRTPGLGNLGDSVRLLEAIDFVRRVAGSRSWVCNCSLGRTGGPHDGTTLVEQGIDELVQTPGRAVVMSTGNYFSHRTASMGRLEPGRASTLQWNIEKPDRTQNELEIWYSAKDDVVVRLMHPSGELAATAELDSKAPVIAQGQQCGRLYHRACDPNNGDHHVDIFLDPDASEGTWRIELSPISVQAGTYHGWIERDPGPRGTQSHFGTASVSKECTTGTICNGKHSIAVGAVDAHSEALPLGRFSSGGKLRDGRYKPDLVAPGVRILAAESTSDEAASPLSRQTRKSGTSMAAPHVTGAVAAMMQAAGRPLHIRETRQLLFDTATKIDRPEDALRLGAGLLNVDAAIRAARALGAQRPSSPSITLPSMALPNPEVTVPVATELAAVWLPLAGSVGYQAENREADLLLVQERLVELGFLEANAAQLDHDELTAKRRARAARTAHALVLFLEQAGYPRQPFVVPGSAAHRLLMRPDLPPPRRLRLTLPIDGTPATSMASRAEQQRLSSRLAELGFADSGTPLRQAIVDFQGRVMAEVTGCILPQSLEEQVLNDPTFGTLSTFARTEAAKPKDTGNPITILLQQVLRRRKTGESLATWAQEAGLPFAFGYPALTGSAAIGGLARTARVREGLPADVVNELAERVARVGRLYDELKRIHLPSGPGTPLSEALEPVLLRFDTNAQARTGLFANDLLNMLRAQQRERLQLRAGAPPRRSERSAFQTKSVLTSVHGQALRNLMSTTLADALLARQAELAALQGQSHSAQRGSSLLIAAEELFKTARGCSRSLPLAQEGLLDVRDT